ncbi:hypothetical protein FRC04_007472 [Tulasnella sp. 424]|nr:hypothetical protein FRC04_007472 [Tulasnella sp. 424]KAG8975155.1 hypothetical protein FRC05_006323 [Tulasnella sp. 425]
MADRQQAKHEVGELLSRFQALGVMGELEDVPPEKFTTEEVDRMFGVVEDAVQRFGRMHKIERPTLRQFLNTQRSVIFRIPLETLSSIFVCASSVQDDPLEEKDALGRCHIRRAVAISHVCSRWYNVAVSCSALWTVCNVDTPRRLIEMALERSSQRPLAFLATGGPYFQTEGSNEALEFLARHIHRWQSARIAIEEYRLPHLLWSPAPALRYLQVKPPASFGVLDVVGVRQTLSAHHFFQGQTPLLETLDIAYWVEWGTPNWPHLRELRIGYWGRGSPTINEATDSTSTKTFSPADLPQLRQLTLVGAYPVPTATVLDHLRCPRLEVATIGFHYHFFGSQEISPMTYHLLGAIKPKLQTLLQGVTRFKLTLATCGVWFCMVRPEQLVSIKFPGFDWRPVLEWALEKFSEIVELCVSALIFPPTASLGNMPTSRFSTVQDLVTPLRNLEVVGVSGNPEISQIVDTFIQEDSQVESSLHIPPNLLVSSLTGAFAHGRTTSNGNSRDVALTSEEA